MAKQARKPLSKRTRFEVLKRDMFVCKYCGAKAPDVLLEIDHIVPVSKGGTDDIFNLITACSSCNRGKSNIQLDDSSVINKQRLQFEILQQKQEQSELFFKWKNELLNIDKNAVKKLTRYFEKKCNNTISVLDTCSIIYSLLKKYDYEIVLNSIDASVDYYCLAGFTYESCGKALTKLPVFCKNQFRQQDNPNYLRCFYVRGILRNRFNLNVHEQRDVLSALILKSEKLTREDFSVIEDEAKSCSDLMLFLNNLLNQDEC